jgi:hypothetical protein
MNTSNSMNHKRIVVPLAILPFLVLAACTSPSPPAGSSSDASTVAQIGGASSDLPKVPFGNRPCQSLTADEIKTLGIAKPAPAKPVPGRQNTPGPDGHPEEPAFDNTCDFGYQTLVYTTRYDYEYQRNNLRSPRHDAPAGLSGAFYDVLGNLWFAEKGYYVAIPNNAADAVKEKMARVIAAKL